MRIVRAGWVIGFGLAACPAVVEAGFTFSTGSPDGKIATLSQPGTGGKLETESADDFILPTATKLTDATFTGLLPSGTPASSINQVVVEIYRVFPTDSDVGRTSGPPIFSTSQVPTRVNSPSDVAFDSRSSDPGGGLSFTAATLATGFTAANSVVNGIHAAPGNTTGGEGAVTGDETRFSVHFSKPFTLPADHYFFVPQVAVSGTGDFLWLSAPRPTVPPFLPDLQSWIRNETLAPDWERVGADVVGPVQGVTTTFNASFSLAGTPAAVPLPPAAPAGAVILAAMGAVMFARQRIARGGVR